MAELYILAKLNDHCTTPAGSKRSEGRFCDDASRCESGAFKHEELVDKKGGKRSVLFVGWR